MFAGGMDPFVGVFLVHGGAVAGEFADVGEGVEQDQFCFDDGGVVAGQDLHRDALLGEALTPPRKRKKSRVNRVGKVKRLKAKKVRGEVKANRGKVDW